MAIGDVVVEESSFDFDVVRGQKVISGFSVNVPNHILKLHQDCPDEMDDPFSLEQINECQIRWNDERQLVEIFTTPSSVSNMEILELDYATFFKEFRSWQIRMKKKYKTDNDPSD